MEVSSPEYQNQLLRYQNNKIKQQLYVYKEQANEYKQSSEISQKLSKQLQEALGVVNKLWATINTELQQLIKLEICNRQSSDAEDKSEIQNTRLNDRQSQLSSIIWSLSGDSSDNKQLKLYETMLEEILPDLEKDFRFDANILRNQIFSLFYQLRSKDTDQVNNVQLEQQVNEEDLQRKGKETQIFNKQIQELEDKVRKYQVSNDKLAALNMAQKDIQVTVQDKIQNQQRQIQKLELTLTEKEERIINYQKKVYEVSQRANQLSKNQNGKIQQSKSVDLKKDSSQKLKDEVPQGELEEWQAKLSQLKTEADSIREVLHIRNQEMQVQRQQSIRQKQDLFDAQLRLNNEDWVVNTKVYQQLSAKLDANQKEKDSLFKKIEDLNVLVQSGNFRETQLQAEIHNLENTRLDKASAARVVELENVLTETRKDLLQTKDQLEQLQIIIRQQKTREELKLMVSTLQNEIALHEARNQKQQSQMQKLNLRLLQESQLKELLAQKEKQLSYQQLQLQQYISDLEQAKNENLILQERFEDSTIFLQAFTCLEDDDFFTHSQDIKDNDPGNNNNNNNNSSSNNSNYSQNGNSNQLNNTSQSNNIKTNSSDQGDRSSRLKDKAIEIKYQREIQRLESQLNGSDILKAKLEYENKSKDLQFNFLQTKRESRDLKIVLQDKESKIKSLDEEIAIYKDICESLQKELEQIGKAYEDMQNQNINILQQLTEKDDQETRMASETLRAVQELQNLKLKIEQQKYQHQAQQHEVEEINRKSLDTENRMQDYFEQLQQAHVQIEQKVIENERLRSDFNNQRDDYQQLENRYQQVQQNSTGYKRQFEQEADKHLKEQNKRIKLEEDNKVLNSKYDLINTSKKNPVEYDLMHQEVLALRKLLRCQVCQERQKEVILTKCFHMFCEQCIKTNLEMRQRKCPACGISFGQHDVKQFYFT